MLPVCVCVCVCVCVREREREEREREREREKRERERERGRERASSSLQFYAAGICPAAQSSRKHCSGLHRLLATTPHNTHSHKHTQQQYK